MHGRKPMDIWGLADKPPKIDLFNYWRLDSFSCFPLFPLTVDKYLYVAMGVKLQWSKINKAKTFS